MTERKNYSRLTCNSNRNTLHIFGEFVIFKNIVRKRRKTIHIVLWFRKRNSPHVWQVFFYKILLFFCLRESHLKVLILMSSNESNLFIITRTLNPTPPLKWAVHSHHLNPLHMAGQKEYKQEDSMTKFALIPFFQGRSIRFAWIEIS